MTNRLIRWFGFIFVLGMLLPAQAQAPRMTIYAIWTPGEQLTSVSGDTRFVTLETHVSGNIQFWAVNVICNIGNGQQLTPVDPATDADSTDPDQFVRWGAVWGTEDTDFVDFVTYNPAIGQINAVATRVGADQSPVGVNGVDSTDSLFTIRFRVNELPYNAQVAVNCFITEFLDRDGNIVLRGYQTWTPNLMIFTGYTLRGQAQRQGATNHLGIEVSCTNYPDGIGQPAGTTYTTTTDYFGNFRFNAQTTGGNLRDFGMYICTFTSAFGGSPDSYFLQREATLNLTTPEYFMLPVRMRPGDYSDDGVIDSSNDIAVITSNWNTFQDYFTNGDANGNRGVEDNDLAIVAGNVGLADGAAGHIVYSLGRDYSQQAPFPNSKVWWGTTESGGVTQMVRFTPHREFWARVSPDGTQIAFIGVDNRTGNYVLWKADTQYGRPFTSSPAYNFPWQLLAPSWSPDGDRLALVCSTKGTTSGYVVNEGYLCIQQADDRTGSTLNVVQVDGRRLKMKVFTPAWYNSNVVIYAGHADDPVCPNTLCFYDMAQNHVGKVQGAGLPTPSDMPDVTWFNDEAYLTYRHVSGGPASATLNMALLDYDPDTQTFSGGLDVPAGSASTHAQVADSTGVDYYAVSPNLDILFYPLDALNFTMLSRGADLTWTMDKSYNVDAMIGNPNYLTEDFGGDAVLWDGDINKPTPLHAERMTFHWVP